MRLSTVIYAALVGAMVAAPVMGAHVRDFNGASAYAPANEWDAPIFRQFAFVEGTVTQYHVLTPETFLMDMHEARLYQFPACQALAPVFEKHHPTPGDGGYWGDHDAPTREIVDVVLSTGCAYQPRSEAEVQQLALSSVPRGLYVNAPLIPPQLADLRDDELFNGPPFRPRIAGWQEGAEVQFITYEASWMPTWVPTNFPAEDADVFIISYGALFRPGWTIINVAAGTPNHPSTLAYSPMWRANCIVDELDQKCMVSVNQQSGYEQCYSVATCTTMESSITGLPVRIVETNTFTHINCPMVSVDLDGDGYIGIHEELIFPDLWTDGPVVV